jgi:hypothetical protein
MRAKQRSVALRSPYKEEMGETQSERRTARTQREGEAIAESSNKRLLRGELENSKPATQYQSS